MKTVVISFTQNGATLSKNIINGLLKLGHDCTGYSMPRFVKNTTLFPIESSLYDLIGELFSSVDSIIFISACAIAVRSISPFLKSKALDPAILVVDDKANFAISLLSGHIGGANELTKVVSNITGATAVISTSTDINEKFAIDTWAAKNDIYISNINMVKHISSQLLSNNTVGFYSDFKVLGALPVGVSYCNDLEKGICISFNDNKKPFKYTLNLVPRLVFMGIGCKKNTPMRVIEDYVIKTLKENSISIKAIKNICSINLKQHEPGLIEFCNKYNVNFKVFSAEELNKVSGSFSSSKFVMSVTGTDNVCERSALLASKNGRLILSKKSCNGVTIALVEEKWRVSF